MSSWSILASAHTCSPSWLLSQTLAHMTHTFHHAITAKKIKLTSRQSRMHISLQQCPDFPSSDWLTWFHLPLLNKKKIMKKKKNISWFPSLAHIPSFHLPLFSFPPRSKHIHFKTHTYKAKFMKSFLCAPWLFASAAGWRRPFSHPEMRIRDERSSWM